MIYWQPGQSQGIVKADSGKSYSKSHDMGMTKVAAGVTARVGTKSPSLIVNRIVLRNVEGRRTGMKL